LDASTRLFGFAGGAGASWRVFMSMNAY